MPYCKVPPEPRPEHALTVLSIVRYIENGQTSLLRSPSDDADAQVWFRPTPRSDPARSSLARRGSDMAVTLDELGGWRPVLLALTAGHDLSADQAHAAMTEILAGTATDAQIAAYIVALRMKGEAVDEVSGMVDAMLEASDPIDLGAAGRPTRSTSWAPAAAPAGGPHALNVSTMACFVAAGAGAPVCKHGNRKASSTSGSFDLLEALGVGIDLDGAGRGPLRGRGRRRVLLRPGVPPGHAPRRSGAGRARHPDPVQLPRAAVEPGPGVAPGDRRQRPGHGPHGGRGAPAAWLGPGHGRARPRRHGRAHHHRSLDRVGGARR